MFKRLIIPGLCAVSAFAQTIKSDDVLTEKKLTLELSQGPIGITAALAGPAANIAGAPYSAQAVTQRVQTLADGNRITQTTTNSVARDSKGRVYREESLPGLGNGTPEPHLVLIEDPVAGVHITLDSNSKTATKFNMAQMKQSAEDAARQGVPPLGPNKMFFSSAGPGLQEIHILGSVKRDDATTTDLGTQTIEGLAARGTRTTHTIPAGEMGNDFPIVITSETWFSPDLKVIVMSKSTDPRMGETTYKLTNLSRAEPDATLFQIPSDYTVQDEPHNVAGQHGDRVFFFKNN
jgi:hypothetical protein